MVSEIFNSILFGELRPWQRDFLDERYFSDVLKQAPLFTFGKTQSLLSRIKSLLKGHPKLWAFPENNLGNMQNLCIEPLYELSLPHPFNSATRFYSELLQAESLRYINNLAVGHAIKKSKPLPVQDKASIENLKNCAQEFLKHFSGYNVFKENIMNVSDYNRLLEYTFYLIEHEQLPLNIKPIPQIGLSANHIRYIFYLMHQSFYGTKEIKPFWIDFLQKVFGNWHMNIVQILP